MRTKLQTMDRSVKDSTTDPNKEFQELAKSLRSIGTEKELMHRCEIFFQAYIENGYDAQAGSYLHFCVIKQLIEEVFQKDISSNILYSDSQTRLAFDGQEHADTWKYFFYAYVGSDFIDGYKKDNRMVDVHLYDAIAGFFQKIISSR